MATIFTANSDAAIEDAAGTDPEPYPPSWVNRLTNWVRGLPVPY